MNKKENINTVTNELKNVLLRAKKEINRQKDELKKTKSVHILAKKEYQTLFNKNAQLKKKLNQYEEYIKSQQIQKKRNEKEKLENERKELKRKQVDEIAILNEIKKLKKLDLENLFNKKQKLKRKVQVKTIAIVKEKRNSLRKKRKRKTVCWT